MKKILKSMMICLMMVSCIACSSKEEAKSWEDQLIEKGTLIVGISPDYPPYETLNTSNELEGFDIDMAKEIEKYLGVKVKFEQMKFETIIDAVNMGQVDVGISGFSYEEGRQVLFSDYYLKSSQVLLVKKKSGIQEILDLDGKVIGAQMGTTGADAVKEIKGANIELNSDAKILVEALKSGQNDAVVLDEMVAQKYVESDSSLYILEEKLSEEENSIITAMNHSLLMDKINEAVQQFKESDAYETLKEKWGI